MPTWNLLWVFVQHDLIWVIVARLTKSTHFIPFKATYLEEEYAKVNLNEIVRMHVVPLCIISDMGPQFTSRFWKAFQSVGTNVTLSSTFHPQKDGLEE